MSDNQEWQFWYYNRVKLFSERLIAPMLEKQQPTINDLIKVEVEANG